MRDLNPFSGRKVKMMEIVFSNFESFKVGASCICDFEMFDLKYSMSFYVQSENDGEINSGCYCNLVFISFNENGMNVSGEISIDNKLKDYLAKNYISHVDLVFDDDSHLNVAVPWIDGDDANVNTLQEFGENDDYCYVKISGLEE